MSPKPIILPYKYKPRPYQVPFFNALQEGYKRFDLVWHRRAGKDLTVINATAMAMADTDNKTGYGGVGSYFYFFPTFAQGKKVIWDGATRDGTRFTDFIPEELRAATWNDEMKIRLKNGSLFQIIGTDSNFDNIMGTNPIWCVFSEYALQNPLAWEYIRPILRENKGRAIFIYTPRGRNHGYTLHYNVAKLNPEYYLKIWQEYGISRDPQIVELLCASITDYYPELESMIEIWTKSGNARLKKAATSAQRILMKKKGAK